MNDIYQTNLQLRPFDNRRLAILCGKHDENLRQIEAHLDVVIASRGNCFQISGREEQVRAAEKVLDLLYQATQESDYLPPDKIHLFLSDKKSQTSGPQTSSTDQPEKHEIAIQTRAGMVRGHTPHQRHYLENIRHYDVNFSIGPAGTGKTYLAVASAVDALEKNYARRLLLVRPAVEAGERLGYLPGGLEQKVEPYLRPLYDALFEMLGFERVAKYIEQNIIEIAPLAFMRGRTLNDAFIILDESQNTTTEQMKMFLTRIGFGSKAIITGDITQIDLPKDKKSGLVEATTVLKDVPGICFTYFDSKDVVRHALVQAIVEAYVKYTQRG